MIPPFAVLGAKVAALKWPALGSALGLVGGAVTLQSTVPTIPVPVLTLASLTLAFGIGGWCMAIQRQTTAAHARQDKATLRFEEFVKDLKVERRAEAEERRIQFQVINAQLEEIGKYIADRKGYERGLAVARGEEPRTRLSD